MATNLLNGAFSSKHFSWRCIRNSLVMSISIAGILLADYALTQKVPGSVTEAIGLLLAVLLPVFLVNGIADYVCLAETRYIVRRNWNILSILVVDILSTYLVTALCIVFMPWQDIWAWVVGVDAYSVANPTAIIFFELNGPVDLRIFATSYVTSIWVWILALARYAKSIADKIKVVGKFVDIEIHPMQSLSLITIIGIWATLPFTIAINFVLR